MLFLANMASKMSHNTHLGSRVTEVHAWIDLDGTKIGYEISFTRYFYQPKPLRALEEIRADILAVQKEAEGLLDELGQGATK